MGFMPSPGRIAALRAAAGPWVRDDGGAESGGEVPIYYDPLISKLAAWGPDRPRAIARMTAGAAGIRGPRHPDDCPLFPMDARAAGVSGCRNFTRAIWTSSCSSGAANLSPPPIRNEEEAAIVGAVLPPVSRETRPPRHASVFRGRLTIEKQCPPRDEFTRARRAVWKALGARSRRCARDVRARRGRVQPRHVESRGGRAAGSTAASWMSRPSRLDHAWSVLLGRRSYEVALVERGPASCSSTSTVARVVVRGGVQRFGVAAGTARRALAEASRRQGRSAWWRRCPAGSSGCWSKPATRWRRARAWWSSRR